MTRPPGDTSAARRRGLLASRWLRLAAGVVALAIVGGAAYGGWYLFLRPAGPAPVGLAALPAASAAARSSNAQSAAPTGGSTTAASSGALASATAPTSSVADQGASSGAAGGAAAAAVGSGGSPGSLDGTWTVNTSIGSGSTGSFVGYRVQEQLAGIGANTAVARTSEVTGSFTLQGTTVTAARFSANLSTLKSDDPRRDGQLATRGLQTNTYPTATFALSRPIELGAIPAQGKVVDVTATGQLTLHGQTRTVEIPLQARLSNGVVAIAGSLEITFSEYRIVPPTSFIALSVANHGTMELQLMFTHG
jgi:polyisoprenoid-binding protein YceI